MTAGRLAASNPSATTNTVLYQAPITATASTVVNVTNWDSGAGTYRMALRDYDQVLHLDGQESQNGGTKTTYQYQKGNPISAYQLEISPGYNYADALPGSNIDSTNGAKAKLLDIFKEITDVTYYTQVQSLNELSYGGVVSGTFQAGETLTGATSGLTATFRGQGVANSVWNIIPNVSNSATSLQISRNTGLADGMYLTLSNAGDTSLQEIVSINASGINTTTNTLTITRSALGTTAGEIPPGRLATAWSASGTVTAIDEGGTFAAADTTLTVVNSTGFVTGSYILIDNEILEVTGVAGNDLTVTRGMVGTTDANHNNAVNVTLLTNNGDYLVNYFSEGEDVTGNTSSASITLNFTSTASVVNQNRFVLSTTGLNATDHTFADTYTLDVDRTYIFDQEHASNTNYPMKFSSDNAEGTNGTPTPGTEYTQNITKAGTAGSSGAFTRIDVADSLTPSLFAYADGLTGSPPAAGGTTGVGFTANLDFNPTYTRIYVYDVSGEPFAAADTFTIGGTTQTIQANGVYAGPYGYVHDFNDVTNHLKVSLSPGSPAFTAGTVFYDTPTLTNADRRRTEVVDGKILTINNIGAADGSRAAGTYANLTPSSTSGSGDLTTTRVTVVVDGSGAATITLVNGGKGHAGSDTITINDGLLGSGGGAALTFDVATISTGVHTGTTGVYSAEDYIFYDKAIASKVTDKNTSIVVGPGQNLLIYGSSASQSFVVNGFETESSDYVEVPLNKDANAGGAAGGAPGGGGGAPGGGN